MDGRTNGKSPHSTGLRPLSGPLPKNAVAVGYAIIEKMVGADMSDFSFKRIDQTITLASKASVKVDGESIQVDTQLLFQRLVLAGRTDLEQALVYELCTIPKSLFEAPDLLHEAQKSTLAETIWTVTGKKDAKKDKNVSYVLDRGALLHRIAWVHGALFSNIFKLIAIMSFLTMARL